MNNEPDWDFIIGYRRKCHDELKRAAKLRAEGRALELEGTRQLVRTVEQWRDKIPISEMARWLGTSKQGLTYLVNRYGKEQSGNTNMD